MAPHTTFRKGKRVLVILHNGERYVDRYDGKSQDNRSVRLKEHGEVRIKHIRAISVYKPVDRTTTKEE